MKNQTSADWLREGGKITKLPYSQEHENEIRVFQNNDMKKRAPAPKEDTCYPGDGTFIMSRKDPEYDFNTYEIPDEMIN